MSVSTDPAQLVTMMKALRNKGRSKPFQDDGTQEDCPNISHVLLNDLEKSNRSNAFDMEKYLTKTEFSSCEGAREPLSRAGTSDMWDLCSPERQTVQDRSMVNVCATNSREAEETTAAIFCAENIESDTQESLRTIASSDSVLTSTRENRNSAMGRMPPSVDTLLDVRNSEKAASVSIAASRSDSLLRNPRVPSFSIVEQCEEIQDNRDHGRKKECVSETSSSDKHVTFEDGLVVLPKSVGKYSS